MFLLVRGDLIKNQKTIDNLEKEYSQIKDNRKQKCCTKIYDIMDCVTSLEAAAGCAWLLLGFRCSQMILKEICLANIMYTLHIIDFINV